MSTVLSDCWALLRAVWVALRFGLPLFLARRTESRSSGEGARWGAVFGKRQDALGKILETLGPSYIKLGQFLATRPDLVGDSFARDLQFLQDRVTPFSQEEAISSVEKALGGKISEFFLEFGPVMASASIAQVHRARVWDPERGERIVAVKILRPSVEARFLADLRAFERGARFLEAWVPSMRRLKPVSALSVLKESVLSEMDLRMEGAALFEMRHNAVSSNLGLHFPEVDWRRTAQRVLTLEWIEGLSLAQTEGLASQGADLKEIAKTIMQSFLHQVLRDGFFHADLHQGNMIYAPEKKRLYAIDLGITGRLSLKDRKFLAEILLGFLTRNYRRLADVHFEAGYVPQTQNKETFAQALCAIGEPIFGLKSEEISMGRLLLQLFQVTERFHMETQPQLLLLQKTMVMVEGVARLLDPHFNMWDAAEPVVRGWMEEHLGPQARLSTAAEGALSFARLAFQMPEVISKMTLLLDSRLHERPAALAETSRMGRVFLFLLMAVIFFVLGRI